MTPEIWKHFMLHKILVAESRSIYSDSYRNNADGTDVMFGITYASQVTEDILRTHLGSTVLTPFLKCVTAKEVEKI